MRDDDEMVAAIILAGALAFWIIFIGFAWRNC